MKSNNLAGGMLLFLIFGASLLTVHGQTAKLTMLFDGRADDSSTDVSAAEKRFVEKEVKKKEVEIREKADLNCDDEDEAEILMGGVASGSFTRPKAVQKAYLYELCRSGRSFGIEGLIVVENERVVAHFTSGENGISSGLGIAPDINQNGLTEILLFGGGTGQGYTQTGVEIIEFAPGGVKSFGVAESYEDDFGANEKNPTAKAFKVFVQKGKNPVYFRETYTKKEDAGKWTLTKKSQKFLLDKDYTPKYHKIS